MSNCAYCGFYVSSSQGCFLLKKNVNPNKDTCSNFIRNPHVCETCGIPIINHFIDISVEPAQILCENCYNASKTCDKCINNNGCDFETNPSSLPKIITQNIRQGNMVIQSQIRNPQRIELTCKNNCKCFHDENECLRQFGCCANHAYKRL